MGNPMTELQDGIMQCYLPHDQANTPRLNAS